MSETAAAPAPGAATRRRIDWRAWVGRLHRYVGLVLAGFLLLAGLTGCILVFHHELDAALNPAMLRVDERAEPPLGPDALAAAAASHFPAARADLIYLGREPGESIRIRLKPRDQDAVDDIYLDPWSGALLGGRRYGAPMLDRAHLMPMLFRLHQQLLIEDWGKRVTGTVALLWLLHSLTGFWLTLPRARRTPTVGAPLADYWRRWRPAWQVKRGAGRARFEFDLHRAAGLWLWGVMAVLAFSAVYFNLRKEIFVPAVSLFSPVTPQPLDALGKRQAPPSPRLDYAAALTHARATLPDGGAGLEVRYVQYLPKQAAYRIAFEPTGRHGEPLRVRFAQVVVDAGSGAPLASRDYDRGTASDRLMAWMFPLHSGQAFGWPGRLLVLLTGLAVALLSWTGLTIWWRKRRAERRSRARTPPRRTARA